MCGRLNTTDDPAVQKLMSLLGVPLWPEPRLSNRFTRATDIVTIIRENNGQRQLDQAIWWLLLDRTPNGLSPSKYTSFNTRYDKLNVPRSAGYQSFRTARCVILAKGFGETEFVNKKPIHYHDMEAVEDEALAFAGLYKEWIHPLTGELVLSCSIITLPPHEKLKHIHSKSMPLILPQQDNSIDLWLDGSVNQVEFLEYLLQPHLPQDLIAYPIDKPSTHNKIGEFTLIPADAA